MRAQIGMAVKDFEDDSHVLILAALAKSANYAEYGAGASTLVASSRKNIKTIFSVETDASWAEFIQKEADKRKTEMILIDLGPVGKWGRPVSYSHADKFERYFQAPFKQKISPDLVYIDGRFRVACFLTSLLFAKPGTTLIIDDYASRPHYEIVENVLSPDEIRGRQAKFFVPSNVDRPQVETLIKKFTYVMD